MRSYHTPRVAHTPWGVYDESMTMEQITAKATQMGLSNQLLELLQAAYDAGQDDRAADIAMDLADDGNDEAVEFLAANYGVQLDA